MKHLTDTTTPPAETTVLPHEAGVERPGQAVEARPQPPAAPVSTRELANRLRAALEWIDDNADDLPGGWVAHTYSGDVPVCLDWHSYANPDMAGVIDALTDLLGPPTLGTTWADEGARPMITVHGGVR